jgi:hypothetical protein
MDEKLKELCWKAFLESGSPGYYMLYSAIEKRQKKD